MAAWPELPWRDWEPTISTLHMWTQIVGKVRLALAPPRNHWWHVPLYVGTRGFTTSPIPYGERVFQVDFDFLDHRVLVIDSDGRSFSLALEPRSVASFYVEFMSGLGGMRIKVDIWPRPVEIVDAIPFDEDETHASYDPAYAEQLWRSVLRADRLLKEFQGGFVGKASPVHFFWGGFDHSTARFSGRLAPRHPGGVPNCPDWVMEEAESHENFSAGWWPLGNGSGPAFYSYTYPEPDGYRSATVRPAEAFYDTRLSESLLPYDAVRAAANPDAAVLEFLQSTYEAGADLGGWDRPTLETNLPRERPPRESYSLGR